MRILALVTDAFGGFGGIAQYNRDFLLACAQSDDVKEIVVLPRLAKSDDRPAYAEKIFQVSPRYGRVAYSWAALQLLIRTGPFDVIFCGHIYMAPVAALLARVFKLRFWLQIHGIEAWSVPPIPLRWAAQEADLVTSVSRYTRRKFLSWANLSPERIRVLPNTIRPEFHPGPKPAHMLERYGLEGQTVLLTVGRLDGREGYKGQERVITILPRLLKRHPKLRYVIAGDGDDRVRIEQVAREYSVDEIVQFIGEVSGIDLPDLYRAADVFVMPSTQEGFGIVFLEAAASGLPVVGGNQDGSLDALADGDLGKAIDPLNEKELKEALVQALSQERATNPCVSRFSFDRFAVAVDSLIAGMRNTANVSTDAYPPGIRSD